jgi:hypothetical protein
MKRLLIIIPALAILAGCGTIGKTFPMPSTMACFHKADVEATLEYRAIFGKVLPIDELMEVDANIQKALEAARNECWWAKGDSKS